MPFPDLPGRLRDVRDRIDAAVRRGGHGQVVTIVAVTKTHGPDAVQAAWDAGLGDVGENRIQEAVPKMDAVSAPVRWHLIGHLQRNKVKALPRFELLHSLDSSRLADAVSEVGSASARPVNALVQVNVVGEETKGGFARAEWSAAAERLRGLAGIHVRGVMTMAPFEADESTLRLAFAGARDARDVLRTAGHDSATELSMGMSNDYEVAVEEGATIVRLGTILFGARPA
jgi:PLP dependent protein